MAIAAHSRGSKPRVPFSTRFGRALRRYFITGLATLFPVAVTVLLVWQIFKFTDGLLGRLFGFEIPGSGLIFTILVIILVGVISIHFFGRVLFQTVEVGLNRLPLIRKIYPAVKQFAQFLFTEEGRQTAFQRVVLVEYPRLGSYALAFVTNESQTAVLGAPRTLLTLLVPQPPSPFTGPVIFVPKEEVIPLNMPIEDALKLIVSGGVVAPPLKAATAHVHSKG